ncbi:MAG TPA: Hsp20/alpha crystallin family protein [Chthonomonadaceae bacterium]|nr:Hsp20/alpha crystallin family protein [Chthonomonadaceae bacterium]
MSLVPQSWHESLEHLRERVHDALDRAFHPEAHTERAGQSLESRPQESLTRLPERLTLQDALSPFLGAGLDMQETDDAVMVRVEMPGIDPRNIQVEVSGRTLWLRAEQKHEQEERRRHFYRYESRYGAFSHAVPLPCKVEAEKARSAYRYGVLSITLPKAADAKARPVKVKVK